MIITREINGIKTDIELTHSELLDAYCELEHEWDCDYVRGLVSEHVPEEKIEEIASKMRRQMDKYDVDISYAFSEACAECLVDEEDIA